MQVFFLLDFFFIGVMRPQKDMVIFIPNLLVQIFLKEKSILKISQMRLFLVQVHQIIITEI